MIILAVDPGPEYSAWLTYDTVRKEPVDWNHEENDRVLERVENPTHEALVLERVAAMGMAVGAEVFETVYWTGRFVQAWEFRRQLGIANIPPADRVKRHTVKMHLCNSMRAKDSNIRQALIDMYGGQDRAIGVKKTKKKAGSPGPLAEITGHHWQALALAITYAHQLRTASPPIKTAGGTPCTSPPNDSTASPAS